MSSLPPLYQNLLAALAPILLVLTVVGGCDWLVSHQIVTPFFSRKLVHMGAASWILTWPLFTTDHWTYKLNILVPAVKGVELFVKGAILRNPKDPDVQTMTRTGNPVELLFGPLQFIGVMMICGWFYFSSHMAVCIMACLGFGDGFAPIVGQRYPWGKYPTYPFDHPGNSKTLVGSVGFFVASLIAYGVLSMVVVGTPPSLIDWTFALQLVSTATVTEALVGSMDNLFLRLVIFGLVSYLQ
eukprot:Nitzschia sp. Nitz4//scaffold255_size41878//22328//23050//NITZ4_007405-RA/size41878-processed-gene-0.14-mRNA-1//1//CDS//3329544371//8115//frame0